MCTTSKHHNVSSLNFHEKLFLKLSKLFVMDILPVTLFKKSGACIPFDNWFDVFSCTFVGGFFEVSKKGAFMFLD